MAGSTHDIKRKIVAAIEKRGQATPSEIAEALDVGGDYVLIRQTLRQMVDALALQKAGRGLYRVHPTFHLRGFDVRDFTERQIEKFLVENCGDATTGAIFDAVAERKLTDGERDYEHRRVTLTLAHSPKFCQDFGTGRWQLTPEAREKLPLLGRLASEQIEVDWHWHKNDQPGDFASWKDKRDDFFDHVGTAFMEARGDLSLEDVAGHPKIHEALHVMGSAAPNARADALAGLRADIEAQCAAEGITGEWNIAAEMRRRKGNELPIHFLAAFELGDVNIHMHATGDFYRACAEMFGVCAARVSRGEVAPVKNGASSVGYA